MKKSVPFLSALSLFTLVSTVPGCFSPANAGYDNVGIRAQALNSDGDVIDTIDHCFTLPLLLGSRIEQSYEIGPGYLLHASATRDEVQFTGEGAASGSRYFEFNEFESAWSEAFEVTTTDGATYRVTLRNGCWPVE